LKAWQLRPKKIVNESSKIFARKLVKKKRKRLRTF
jgi:hypothetical protein